MKEEIKEVINEELEKILKQQQPQEEKNTDEEKDQ